LNMRYLTGAMPAIAVPAITLLGIATDVRPDVVLAGFLGGLVAIVVADKWTAKKGRGK
jgi:hypothetical protein